jgi:hypothetical protein
VVTSTPRNRIGAGRYYAMTESDMLREQARVLRDLALRTHTAEIKELLRHLAEECERLALRLEREDC